MTNDASASRLWHAVEYPARTADDVRLILQRVAATLARLQTDAAVPGETFERVRSKWLGTRIPRTSAAQPARVWISALCDLAMQGWGVRVRAGSVQVSAPVPTTGNPQAEKARVRAGHLLERDRLLRDPGTKRFVVEMERRRLHAGAWHSVFSLMRDGRELRRRLEAATGESREASDPLKAVIDPYLQLAESGVLCEHTGLDLYDIWRYFRLTWSTVPQSVPGRRVHLLVRDRAAPSHPVIGIAALGSAVVQLGVRDSWIGWDAASFVSSLTSRHTREDANWLCESLRQSLAELYVKDLIRDGVLTKRELSTPTEQTLERLRKEGKNARATHERFARSGGHKAATSRPESADWKKQAETFLFRSKRALTLATLLEVKAEFDGEGMREGSKDALGRLLASRRGRKAVTYLLRSIKARHVGIDMADVTVCGAVAPYADLLGGKLVSLLLGSPEVAALYERKYKDAVSLIASGMNGALVRRKPHLVLLGTTSLYGVGASQYNRLSVPKAELGANAVDDLKYVELGRTVGYGSYHFSQATAEEIAALAQQRRDGRRVNSIFGEGVNPKLRRIREALEACGFQPDVLLQHGSPRIVYGIPLATNFREVLLGRTSRVRRVLGSIPPAIATELIASYWRRRWLAMRIANKEIMARLDSHLTTHPVQHGARVTAPVSTDELTLFETS